MKKLIKVIRIEHPYDGNGFWNAIDENRRCRDWQHSEHDKIRYKHRNMNKWPSYSFDEELVRQISIDELQKYKFAFISIVQLQTAFSTSQLKECIEKLGFKIYILSVNDYFESPFQIVFRNPLEKEDISSLFV